MNDPLKWAAHYRQRAADCMELADGSFDSHRSSLPVADALLHDV